MSLKTCFLVFPTSLIEDISDYEDNDCILIDDPLFYNDKDRIINFNKLKLIYHKATMMYYKDYLKKKKLNVKYIEYHELNNYKDIYKIIGKSYDKIRYYNPYDHLLTERLNEECRKQKIEVEMLDNPIFVDTIASLDDYIDKKKKEKKKKLFFQTGFYLWQRKRLKLLESSKTSYDKENRNKLPKNITIPKTTKPRINKYIQYGVKYVNKYFNNNVGNTDNLLFPITHKDAKLWYIKFIKERLIHFGDYQDAITLDDNPFLYHSGSSVMMNIGLITQNWMVDKIINMGKELKIKMNNIEGLIRQLIGWNSFSRLYYMKAKYDLSKSIFHDKNKMNDKWWNGTTNIIPLDITIKKAFNNGYLHHIERLMIMLNFQLLCGIDYEDIYRWHMEYSCDAYDVYMIYNVYSMGYGDGGLTTTKPYISSSNYIKSMSNFKGGEWEKIWDALYYRFIDVNYNKLEKINRMKFMIDSYNKKTKSEINEYKKIANEFIKTVTKN